jgi:hypothetical protein
LKKESVCRSKTRPFECLGVMEIGVCGGSRAEVSAARMVVCLGRSDRAEEPPRKLMDLDGGAEKKSSAVLPRSSQP